MSGRFTLGPAVSRLLRPVPLVALAGVLALVALLGYGVASKQADTSIDTQLAAGKRPAGPAISLAKLDGAGKVPLASYKGQVVVLNFWASWCGPCRSEAPVLERWQKKLLPQQATVVGVDVLDVSDDARKFIGEFHLSYPQLRDGDGSNLKRFDVVGYPETVVLDRQGRIAATSRGAIDEKFFTEKVVPLLKERS
ncbi:MAG: cytochrome c biosis protein CcmG, thiol:disulfide interchange protein DsbE [Thermoleophilaceae bacterium]|jgi:cytochrome c biogenesis protein CcmG/thiol:disulfide interchange protein DsbE|nr:cytochrome c biosis protein CcmG, thiol:disulfide interchange protein DsbE [Thermoleophilaceae bacterium]